MDYIPPEVNVNINNYKANKLYRKAAKELIHHFFTKQSATITDTDPGTTSMKELVDLLVGIFCDIFTGAQDENKEIRTKYALLKSTEDDPDADFDYMPICEAVAQSVYPYTDRYTNINAWCDFCGDIFFPILEEIYDLVILHKST
jgi:hypothetical protein